MENIYVFAFATFGHPNDFRQNCFLPEKRQSDIKVKLFDLTNAIKIYPNSTLYSIRKENVNGVNIISYAIYTYAKEKTSDRDGTFIGSSIIYTNGIASENVTVEKLKNFHTELINKNVVDERLIVNHSNEFSISKSVTIDFDKLSNNLKKIEEPINFNLSNNNVVVYSLIDSNTLQQNFKKALELLNGYDTIFFTDSEEIAKFVVSKRLYKFLDENNNEFTNTIQSLLDEKKKNLNVIINDYERELSELEEKKRITIRNIKESIELNSRLHQENSRKIEESKKKINNIENKYSEFSKKIKEAINLINANNKIEEVKLFHNENKREFINYINQNTSPTYLNSLNDIHARTNLPSNNQNNPDWLQPNNNSKKKQKSIEKPFNFFKILTFIFFILWVLTLLNFLVFNNPNLSNENDETILENHTESEIETSEILLNPIPNNELNTNDIKIIAKNLDINTTIEEVVKLIFEKNPTDIKKHYGNQLELYSKKIIELNKNCFEERDGINYYNKKDTIKNIPSFK